MLRFVRKLLSGSRIVPYSDSNLLDLAQGHLVGAAIVELRGFRGRVTRQLLNDLQSRFRMLQIGRSAGGAVGVVAHIGFDIGRLGRSMKISGDLWRRYRRA